MSDYGKWLAFGTGVGIEIAGRDLDVTMVRVRPHGAQPLAHVRIQRFADRPAGEWGSEYAAWLKRNGGSHLAATVLLPRRDVIVRQIAMPGVADGDLAQAIAFQLDGLHPFAEEDAVSAWSRMAGGVNVLIGIARRDTIDSYTGLFAEAGVKVASITFSAAAMYASLRLLGAPPATGFLAAREAGDEVEAYGESDARPLFSAAFDVPNEAAAERTRAMALAELRLPQDVPVTGFSDLLPKPKRAAEGFDANRLSYAAALVAACPRRGVRVNLLPEERRATGSRMMFVPSVVLGVLLLGGAGGLWAYSSWQDRQYLDKLRAEIAKLEPDARKPLKMDKAIDVARARTMLLDQFRKRTRDDLDVIAEMTKIFEAPAWITGLDLARDSVRMSGEAPQAAGLLRIIDKSPLFEGSEFAAPMSRTQTGEVFSIRARREAGR
jgi:hypothetical protein